MNDLNIGIAADDQLGLLTVFDSETNTILSTVSVPLGSAIGDVLLLEKDEGELLAFVTNFNSQVIVYDLSDPAAPSLKTTISISNFGEDLTFAEVDDTEFLIVSDGSAEQPLSVIDLKTLKEVSTFGIPGSDFNSVEFIEGEDDEGFILATSNNLGLVYKLSINEQGIIQDTGLSLSIPVGFSFGANNVYGSPEEGEFGVVITRGDGMLISFDTDSMTQVDTVSLGREFGLAGVFSEDDDDGDGLFFAVSTESVQAFNFDLETGELGNAPIWRTEVDGGSTFFGMDQIAFNEENDLLYIGNSDTNSIFVLNPDDGTLVSQIIDPSASFGDPTGIAFATEFG